MRSCQGQWQGHQHIPWDIWDAIQKKKKILLKKLCSAIRKFILFFRVHHETRTIYSIAWARNEVVGREYNIPWMHIPSHTPTEIIIKISFKSYICQYRPVQLTCFVIFWVLRFGCTLEPLGGNLWTNNAQALIQIIWNHKLPSDWNLQPELRTAELQLSTSRVA